MRFAISYLRRRPALMLSTANAIAAWLLVAVTGDPICLAWAMLASFVNGVATTTEE